MKIIATLLQYASAVHVMSLLLHSSSVLVGSSNFTVGTASFGDLSSPACQGASPNGFVAGVSNEIFKDGAACGQEYELYCFNSAKLGNACVFEAAKVTVTIVDRCVDEKGSKCTTFVLSQKAFEAIAKPEAGVAEIIYRTV